MDELLMLKWHRHESTILTHLATFLDEEAFTDCTVSVGGVTLKAHRLVLATCSAYFLKIFQEMPDIQHPVVILNDVALEDFKAALSFMYRGQCVVDRGRVEGLLAIGRMLKIRGLCDMQVPDKGLTAVESEVINSNDTRKGPKDLSETCKCFLCGKYLSNQYNLRVHMETHEEAYHACQSCPHVSRSRDALRKHVSYRHPEEYHTRKRKKL